MSNELVKSVVRSCVDSLVANSEIANGAIIILVKALFWSFSDRFVQELTCSIQSLRDSDTHAQRKNYICVISPLRKNVLCLYKQNQRLQRFALSFPQCYCVRNCGHKAGIKSWCLSAFPANSHHKSSMMPFILSTILDINCNDLRYFYCFVVKGVSFFYPLLSVRTYVIRASVLSSAGLS